MKVRWWRVGVVFERDGDPWTWTLHVRALTEASARRLVAERVGEAPHAVYACQPSEPLLRVAATEEVVADYGPYRRSWQDPTIAHLRSLLRSPRDS
ncbi:MAG: hypothetical protein ACYTEZ_01520 [Planctomycetota bacterium]|jgi:hypothetical protein